MLRTRSAAEYADFLLPHLDDGFHVLDVGCGAGTITVGLAERLTGGRVIGVDPSGDGFSEALRYAEDNGIGNVDFRVGDVYALDFPSDRFDACLCHSMLETLEDPLGGAGRDQAHAEAGRRPRCRLRGVRRPHPRRAPVKSSCWSSMPFASGSGVRTVTPIPTGDGGCAACSRSAGFDSVLATSKYWSYGTPEAVRSFGRARAEDCGDGWYRSAAVAHGFAGDREIDAMRAAWLEWSESPDAYLSFAWCRALGWKPR